MEPILSIIIVTRNDRDNLVSTLNSIAPSEFIEVIIQDGSSDYDVRAVLESHRLFKLIKLKIESDTGVYDAMNRALERASGVFICFLNCGDKFVEAAERFLLPTLLNAPESFLALKFLAKTPDNGVLIERATKVYFFRRMLNHQSIIYRREAFDTFRFDSRMKIAADLRHFLEAELITRTGYIDIVLIDYLGGGLATQKQMINRNWSERSSAYRWRICIIQKVILIAAVVLRTVAVKVRLR